MAEGSNTVQYMLTKFLIAASPQKMTIDIGGSNYFYNVFIPCLRSAWV